MLLIAPPHTAGTIAAVDGAAPRSGRQRDVQGIHASRNGAAHGTNAPVVASIAGTLTVLPPFTGA